MVVLLVLEADFNCSNSQRSKRLLYSAVPVALVEVGYFRSKDNNNSKDSRSLDSSNNKIKFLRLHTALSYPFPTPGHSFPRHHQSHVSPFSAMRAFRATFRDPRRPLWPRSLRDRKRHERRGYNLEARHLVQSHHPRIKKQSSYPDENTAVVECRRIWINLRTTHMKSRNRKVVQFKTGSEGRILLRMVGCSSRAKIPALYSFVLRAP